MRKCKLQPKFCEYCQQSFQPKLSIRRFCSKSCSSFGSPRSYERHKFAESFYSRNAERVKAEKKQQYHNDPHVRKKALARAMARRHHPNPLPCEMCGNVKADRHHDNYDEPLNIKWLCRSCHIKHHVEEEGSWGIGLSHMTQGL